MPQKSDDDWLKGEKMTTVDMDTVMQDETEILSQADENIEQHRKGNLILKFINAANAPIQGAEVVVDRTSHDFLFGNIIFPYLNL